MKRVAVAAVFLLILIQSATLAVYAEAPDKPGKGGMTREEKVVLEEIMVTAPSYANPSTPVDTRYSTQYNVVTEEQIKEQNAYDFTSALRDVPGVMSQSKNMIGSQTSHSLYIRGRGASHPSSDFAIEFDGAPRYGALFGQVMSDGIPVTAIGSIEVYKSPQLSQFGNGYASINIVPKHLKKEGQEAVLNASAGSFRTYNESLAAGFKKGPVDLYMSQGWIQTDGNRANAGTIQQSYYGNTGYQINREWNIRVLANYAKSSTDAPMPNMIPSAINGASWPGAESYDTETFFGTLTLNHQYEKTGGYLKAYLDHTDFDLLQELTNGQRYAKGTGGLKSRQQIWLQGFRGREKLTLWPGGEILLGADLDMTRLTNSQMTYNGNALPGINGGKALREWDFPDTTLFSPYMAISHLFGRQDGFHITPSAAGRYFNHNEFKNKAAAQGGATMGYRNTDVRLNYSRGINYPSPVVLMNFVNNASPAVYPSQYWKDLKPEVVDHYEAGITHTWPKIATVAATAFYDKGKDRFQAYMFGAVPLQLNDPIGDYSIRGLELTGTITPSKSLECFAGATWIRAKATGSDGIERDHMPYTPGFQFQAGSKWTFWSNFRIFADMQHLRNLYQGTAARSNTFNYSGVTSADKLDDITLFNARLSYHFDNKSWRLGNSEVFVAFNNIFNQRYEYAKGYPMPGNTVFTGLILRLE